MFDSIIPTLRLKKVSYLVILLTLFSCQHTKKDIDLSIKKYEGQNDASLNLNNHYINNINCLDYCPNSYSNNIIVDHEIIILSMNTKTKFADWVAYRVDKKNMGGESKPRNWKKDPKLNEEITLIPSDYRGLSLEPYFFDRGHQAPLAAFKNHKKWYVVNYLSNITPQRKYLNQGPWNKLEAQERELADRTGEIFVLTGPYYEEYSEIKVLNPKRIDYIVPSGYWKMIAVKDKEEIRTISFLFSQNTDRNDNYCNHISSIEKIKKKTALEFSRYITSVSDQSLKHEIGCVK